jgi:hypothetical protein
MGTGLGLSAYLTFFSFIVFRKFNPPGIIMINSLALASLLFYADKKKILSDWQSLWKPKPFSWANLGIGVLWISLSFFIYYTATKHPYGQWDAWGMWNLKTKFFITSANPWEDVLHRLSEHTHPDYPLLLPFLNIWGMSFCGHYDFHIPFFTAILFTILTTLAIFNGLKLFIPRPASFLAATIFMANPYAAFWATAQYADIILAFFFTIAIILLWLTLKTQSLDIAKLLAIMLGFAAFTKNEGLLLTLLLVLSTLLSMHLFKKPSFTIESASWLIRWLIIGCVPVIIFKIFFAPSNADILPFLSLANTELFNAEKLGFIIMSFFKEIIDQRWSYVWIFILILFFSKIRAFFKPDTFIVTATFLVYFLIVAFIYQTAPQEKLSWWIQTSLKRVYFSLLPSIIFLSFYAAWHTEKANNQK